jgi:hypothetical protein
VTLDGLVRLRLQVRSCRNPECPRHRACLRPEQEGSFARPQHEFGLDVVALVGVLRHAEHRSLPEIHAELVRRGVPICVRSVDNLLDRYDELLARSCSDVDRLKVVTAQAGRVVLAIDGLQPDVGHEVLWVIRDVLSGALLLARSLLSSSQDDLAKLLGEVKGALSVPIVGASPTARHRSARRSPRAWTGSRINSASSLTCARRPCRSTRPIAARTSS